MPIYVMAKPNGSSCNLNCSYCYYLEKENLYENRKNLQMSDGTLELYVEKLYSSTTCSRSSFYMAWW